MQTGQTDIQNIAKELSTIEGISCRIALRNKGDQWLLHRLIVDAGLEYKAAEWSVYDYGQAAFVNERLKGEEAAEWMLTHSGQAAGYRFSMPQLNSLVSWSRETSHTSNTGYNRSIYRLPCPHTIYRPQFQSGDFEIKSVEGPLIKDGCPIFPHYYDAVYRLLYDTGRVFGEDFQPGDIIIRITHPEAWIESITVKPRQASVVISGSKVEGTRLVIGGTDKSFEESLKEPGTFNYELPQEQPHRLWMILARGDQCLDSRDLDLTRGVPYLGWDNIFFEPGSICEQIKEWIYQGENNSVEFKQQLPPEEDRFLKTVAAFANGDGGVILLGVVNGTGEIKGITADIGPYKDGITDRIRRKLTPHPEIHIEHCEIDGRTVVAVMVEEGGLPPYGLNQGVDKPPAFYVRRNATTFIANSPEIRAAARKRTFEEQAQVRLDGFFRNRLRR